VRRREVLRGLEFAAARTDQNVKLCAAWICCLDASVRIDDLAESVIFVLFVGPGEREMCSESLGTEFNSEAVRGGRVGDDFGDQFGRQGFDREAWFVGFLDTRFVFLRCAFFFLVGLRVIFGMVGELWKRMEIDERR